jgi:ACS family glucarate transporter-like MFS transporter
MANSTEPTRVRFLVVGLCIAMSILLYLDRFALSPTTDTILRELNLTKEQLGRTFFMFFFAYALMQVPAGWLSDTLGARSTLALYVVGWSLATIGLGLVNGLFAISLVRLLLGVTQAGAYPAAASLLKRWIPLSARGRANSSVSMGGRLGGLIAFFFTPILMLQVGRLLGWETGRWRIVFVLYGSLGLIWAVIFWWLYRDSPREHPWCNAAEADLVGTPPPAVAKRPSLPLAAILQSREVWLMCLAGFTVNIGWVFLVSWLPQYLIETYGDYVTAEIGDKQVVAGMMTAATGLAGMCGTLLGGAATDALVRGYGRKWGRRLPGMCSGTVVLGLYLLAPGLASVWLFVGAMIAISFTIDFGLGATWASYQDIGGRHVASVLGVGNMCGNLGAAVFTWLIGLLAESDRWNTVFLLSGIAMLVNACCWLMLDVTRPVVREAEP